MKQVSCLNNTANYCRRRFLDGLLLEAERSRLIAFFLEMTRFVALSLYFTTFLLMMDLSGLKGSVCTVYWLAVLTKDCFVCGVLWQLRGT